MELCENKNKKTIRVDLRVPYSEKDEAKALGARWDPSIKKWYVLSNNVHYNELIDRWKY
jgi:hypothetical protein